MAAAGVGWGVVVGNSCFNSWLCNFYKHVTGQREFGPAAEASLPPGKPTWIHPTGGPLPQGTHYLEVTT